MSAPIKSGQSYTGSTDSTRVEQVTREPRLPASQKLSIKMRMSHLFSGLFDKSVKKELIQKFDACVKIPNSLRATGVGKLSFAESQKLKHLVDTTPDASEQQSILRSTYNVSPLKLVLASQIPDEHLPSVFTELSNLQPDKGNIKTIQQAAVLFSDRQSFSKKLSTYIMLLTESSVKNNDLQRLKTAALNHFTLEFQSYAKNHPTWEPLANAHTAFLTQSTQSKSVVNASLFAHVMRIYADDPKASAKIFATVTHITQHQPLSFVEHLMFFAAFSLLPNVLKAFQELFSSMDASSDSSIIKKSITKCQKRIESEKTEINSTFDKIKARAQVTYQATPPPTRRNREDFEAQLTSRDQQRKLPLSAADDFLKILKAIPKKSL